MDKLENQQKEEVKTAALDVQSPESPDKEDQDSDDKHAKTTTQGMNELQAAL